MDTLIGAAVSGIVGIVGKIFGSPLDFLSGKSCSSVCGVMWDVLCYIENFCVANLFRLAMVSTLLYFVLLFFYVVYKLGICGCAIRSVCRMGWSCFAIFFYLLECCCNFLCYKLPSMRRKNRRCRRRLRRDMEALDVISSSSSDDGLEEEEEEEKRHSSQFSRRIEDRRRSGSDRQRKRRRRDYKGDHLRKSLKPRTTDHGVSVGINYVHNSARGKHRKPSNHDIIGVSRSSKFAKKSSHFSNSMRRRRIEDSRQMNRRRRQMPENGYSSSRAFKTLDIVEN